MADAQSHNEGGRVLPMDENAPKYNSNIPIPDPSAITTEQIGKAKTELRSEFVAAVAALQSIIQTRLDAMDKAAAVAEQNINRVPTTLDREAGKLKELFEEKFLTSAKAFDTVLQSHGREVSRLQELINERFNGIQIQFRERDIRTDQDKLAATTAVNAALQAQKEAAGAQNVANAAAITKSENGFTKEIDGLKELINTTRDAINNQIANLTGRFDRGEGNVTGAKDTRSESRLGASSVVGIVGGVVGMLTLAAMIIFGVVTSIHR
jgi:hypothetical protein